MGSLRGEVSPQASPYLPPRRAARTLAERLPEGLRIPLQPGQTYYLFIEKADKTGRYHLPTPASGWAQVESGEVYATYRHSYHQAVVPEDLYERTMRAIFNRMKGKQYDARFVVGFVREQLAQNVASWDGEDDPVLRNRFFLQHVALETVYHLGSFAPEEGLVHGGLTRFSSFNVSFITG